MAKQPIKKTSTKTKITYRQQLKLDRSVALSKAVKEKQRSESTAIRRVAKLVAVP